MPPGGRARPAAPPDAAVARFAADLTRIAGSLENARIGIAVSGGPDSLALLLLAHAALPGNVFAATVDHGLRAEAGTEAAFVADVAARLGVPHMILKADIGRGNVSAKAREARYGLLDAWGRNNDLTAIATAHHADDQLETMIMRMNRGSGLAGLAGIRRRNGRIVRPLLTWRKHDLASVVKAAGLIAVDDPSNRDDRYDRARLRKEIAGADWLDPLASTRTAAALEEANEALDWAMRAAMEKYVASAGSRITIDPHGLPHELVRRLFIACLARIDSAAAPRGDAVERAIDTLGKGGVCSLGSVRCAGGEKWILTPAAPRRATRTISG